MVKEALRAGLVPGLLVLCTGEATDKLALLSESLDEKVQFVNVSKYLSTELLEVPRSRRALKALQFLGEKAAKGATCFYDLEILFDPGMELDVLPALKTLSKGRELYLDWPGSWKPQEKVLCFAEPEDPAYRAYSLTPDVGVVDLSGETYPTTEL